MLIPHIVSYYFCRYFVANRTDKVTIVPQFPSPELFLYLRELLEHYLGGDTFKHLHYLRMCKLRRNNQKTSVHGHPWLQSYLFPNRTVQLSLERFLSIFSSCDRRTVFYGISGSIQNDTWDHRHNVCFCSMGSWPVLYQKIILTSSGYPFHPISRTAGYSRMFFIKVK